ncbi:hypothetical protein A2U01_0002280 [Trifolium medium]|uniref:Uncharacterized protein n=1 Tax=Trifolium medium TaxID=97028 RepID=A0A392M2J5_9FABA|nr:hypothetical protein [Trifolium medium]
MDILLPYPGDAKSVVIPKLLLDPSTKFRRKCSHHNGVCNGSPPSPYRNGGRGREKKNSLSREIPPLIFDPLSKDLGSRMKLPWINALTNRINNYIVPMCLHKLEGAREWL